MSIRHPWSKKGDGSNYGIWAPSLESQVVCHPSCSDLEMHVALLVLHDETDFTRYRSEEHRRDARTIYPLVHPEVHRRRGRIQEYRESKKGYTDEHPLVSPCIQHDLRGPRRDDISEVAAHNLKQEHQVEHVVVDYAHSSSSDSKSLHRLTSASHI